MTFLEALKAVMDDPTKMAVPVIVPERATVSGIVFRPTEYPCWGWCEGTTARIPAPQILFGRWKVVEKTATLNPNSL